MDHTELVREFEFRFFLPDRGLCLSPMASAERNRYQLLQDDIYRFDVGLIDRPPDLHNDRIVARSK